MERLINEVRELVEREYGRASAKFGCANNSDHESYAVILEERDEAWKELEAVDRRIKLFWEQVKLNGPDQDKFEMLKNMETSALLSACELIQVAAMAKKAAITVCDRNAKEELGCVSTSESTPASPAPLPLSQFTETDIAKLKSNPSQSPDTSGS